MSPYGINVCEGCYQYPCECERAEAEREQDRALERADSPVVHLDFNPQQRCECGYLPTELRPGVWMCPCDLGGDAA